MMKMADEERSMLSKERNDISRKHQDLLEVVTTLRSELVSNERRIRELDAELITVSNALSGCLLTDCKPKQAVETC